MKQETTSQSNRRQFRFRTMRNGRPYAETFNSLTGTWSRTSYEVAKDLVKRGFADNAGSRPLIEAWAHQADAEYGSQS